MSGLVNPAPVSKTCPNAPRRLSLSAWARVRPGAEDVTRRTVVGAAGAQPFAYSSAVRESNSNPTTASSPTTQAACPGSITYACPARISCSVPSSWTTCIVPDCKQTDVVGLAAFASHDRLHALRPSPAGLQPHARRIRAAHAHDLDRRLVRRPSLVG